MKAYTDEKVTIQIKEVPGGLLAETELFVQFTARVKWDLLAFGRPSSNRSPTSQYHQQQLVRPHSCSIPIVCMLLTMLRCGVVCVVNMFKQNN
jgi:hypothetical protein